jgi:hypothetical protein
MYPATALYSDGDAPRPQDKTIIKAWSSLSLTGKRSYIADDPCWPATYNLNQKQAEILERCRNGIAFDELSSAYSPLEIQSLLNAGVLVTVADTISA